MTPLIIAIQNGKVVAALDAAQYQGLDAHWPHGFAHLSGHFDVYDLDVAGPKAAAAIIDAHKP